MVKAEFVLLAEKVFSGVATDAELALYIEECNSLNANFEQQESASDLNKLLPEMEQNALNRFWDIQQRQNRIFPLWKKIIVATTGIAAIMVGVYFYLNTGRIVPGRNVAMLTLSNGKKIELSELKTGVAFNNEKLVYNDGEAIDERISTGLQVTAITPRGGTYQFSLPDGTSVWLNADSKLIFSSEFKKNERRVELIGEAYFSVQHRIGQPFRVYSKGQVVEDIGTEFNVNAYADETAIQTTLIEGVASVNKHLLRPGQQSNLKEGKLTIYPANIKAVSSWKNGEFVFDDESLGAIMKKISRWYDVEIIYEGVDPSETFAGSISRFAEVSKVLENLELTGEVHFKISGKKIYVSP